MASNQQTLINKFATYLKLKGFSERTIENYLHSLTFFYQWLGENNLKDIKSVRKEQIHDYQSYLYYYQIGNKKFALATQCVYLQGLRCFFRFLVKHDLILYDPTNGIEYPKLEKSLPRGVMTKQEIRRLLKQPNTTALLGYRDRTILELFYSTGIRLNELRHLTIYDIDLDRNILRINKGKGGKDRIIPIGNIPIEWLRGYLQDIRPKLVRSNQQKTLFVSIKGNPLQKSTLNFIGRVYAKKAKLKKHITCHSFRHTCATHMLESGADIRYIQELLGHKRLDTTQIYTKVAITDLKKIHSKYHPREKDYKRQLTHKTSLNQI